MSNFISILTNAYYNNIAQEISEAGKSFVTMLNPRDTLTEADIAKVSSFGLKLLGTLALVDLGSAVLGVMRKRSISVGRLFFTATSFFLTLDFLKALTNLREKYVSDLSEKQGRKADPRDGVSRRSLRTVATAAKHALDRGAQGVKRAAEDFVTEDARDRDTVEGIRFLRVCQVAIKGTSIFASIASIVAERMK